jgi:phage gpG-like protein
MIDIQITGTLPKLNDNLEPAMEKIADIMFRSVQQNFLAGGRPNQWAPLQPFGESSHLMKSGKMFENIQLRWDSTSATVYLDSSRVPYAAIHNFGGTIKHPGSDKFQAFEYMGGLVVLPHGTKPHDIPIPQRMFMLFQEEDKTKILEILSSAIFIQNGETIQ